VAVIFGWCQPCRGVRLRMMCGSCRTGLAGDGGVEGECLGRPARGEGARVATAVAFTTSTVNLRFRGVRTDDFEHLQQGNSMTERRALSLPSDHGSAEISRFGSAAIAPASAGGPVRSASTASTAHRRSGTAGRHHR
jgi:hypothetical protein